MFKNSLQKRISYKLREIKIQKNFFQAFSSKAQFSHCHKVLPNFKKETKPRTFYTLRTPLG